MASAIAGFNAIRFFLCSYMKSLAYMTLVDTVEDLLARVLGALQKIQQTPCVMERVWGYQNMSRMYNGCNELGGHHIEPLL